MKATRLLFFLVSLIPVSAWAAGSDQCQANVGARYLGIPAVSLEPSRNIEVNLEESFWWGLQGLTIVIDGQNYIELKAENVEFTAGTERGMRALAESYKKVISMAKILQQSVKMDPATLRGQLSRRGRCVISEVSLATLIVPDLPTAPEETPVAQPQEPAQTEQPANLSVDGDRSVDQAPVGNSLSNNGDRS